MKRAIIVMLAMVMGAVLMAGTTGCLSTKVAKRKAKKNVPGMHTKEEKIAHDAKKSVSDVQSKGKKSKKDSE